MALAQKRGSTESASEQLLGRISFARNWLPTRKFKSGSIQIQRSVI